MLSSSARLMWSTASCAKCTRSVFTSCSLANPLKFKSVPVEPSKSLLIQSNEVQSIRKFQTSQVNEINFFTPRDDTTLWGRTLKKLGFTEIPKSVSTLLNLIVV